MEQSQLETLYQWFEHYVASYQDNDPEGNANIRLKILHTRKVCQAMEMLCAGENLSQEQTRIALATALLHDVGRFPQYRRWRTFRDSDSDNHARLAIEVIRSEGLLSGLPPQERIFIEEAVRFHNRLELPDRIRSAHPQYIRLIRDADKLDIWRVFSELLVMPAQDRPTAATLGFPDLPDQISQSCLESLSEGRIVRLENVRTLNDFKLLQISWVYDLNYRTARRILLERGHIPALSATLPKRDDLEAAVAKALATLQADSA